MSNKCKVYITRRIPECGIELLRKECDVTFWDSEEVIDKKELLKNVPGVTGLLCMLTDKIDKEVLDEAGPQLKIVATMSVGYEHIDVEECQKRGIVVANTPNVSTSSVAELTVSLLLLTARRLVEGVHAVEHGEWGKWKPMWLCGMELKSRTVGIFGLGRIGYGVAKRIQPFEINRILYNDMREMDYAKDVGAEFTDFDTLITESDVVVICCNLSEETRRKFNKDVFKKMKKSAVLINSGRGAVVNHDDLYDALTSGDISAAGLDVTDPEPLPSDHKLVGLENCIILPHMGSNTWESRNQMAEIAAKNVLDVFHGDTAYGQV